MRLVVVGADGRMGRMLIRAVAEAEGCTLSGAIEREGSPALGQDAGTLAGLGALGVTVTDDPLPVFAAAEGVLDFTAPAATTFFAELAAQAGNMSLGVNLVAGLVRRMAAALGEDFDIEILEMHHRMKVDAPSGTALLLGEAAAQGRDVALADARVSTRDGHTGARRPGDIGFATLRGGSVVGDHSVTFAGAGERITLSHHAEDRGIFARGAVRAAQWAFPQAPGLYGMTDVLGL